MKWTSAVLVVMCVSTGAAAEPDWAIDPPPGWSRNRTLEQEFRGEQGAIPNVKIELRLWESPDKTAVLMVEWYLVDLKNRTDHEMIEVLDAAPFSRTQITARVDRPERIIGSQVIRDTTGIELGKRVRRLRRFQRTSDGLHALLMMCTSSGVTPCDASLERARLLPSAAGAPALRDGDPPGRGPAETTPESRPWTYRVGLVLGIAGVLALVLALLFRRRDLRRRRRRA